MFLIDDFAKGLAFMCFMLLCGWGWRLYLRKKDPEGYQKQMARDQFVKKHGLILGTKLLKKWMK